MENEITSLTIEQLIAALRSRKISSTEITKAYLDRIEEFDSEIHSYITVDSKGALEAAHIADERLKKGEARSLEGVPMGIKDIFVTEGLKTTAGSKILHNWIPAYEGTPTRKLREAGAVFLGKLNMDEFAMGSSTENSYFGPSRNPWDTDRIPGGSSGGSAAAVAARLCAGTLGTDTGGSIRQPASVCGIVGIKPTYGRVSRYGVIAFASSLDQVGPMTRSVRDAAILLRCIAGHDPMDSTSIPKPVPDYLAAIKPDLKGMKIGVPKEYFIEGTQPETAEAVKAAIGVLKNLGAEIDDISLPHTEYAIATYYIIAPAEASSNLARYDGVKYGYRKDEGDGLIELYKASRSEGFGDEVQRRIMIGTYVLSAGYYDAYYRKAMQARTLIRRDFEHAFEKVDAIVTPTSPTTAFKIGERTADPLQMYLSDIFTVPCNLAGLPGMSVPCGFDNAGLPIGLQILAPALAEETIFHISGAFESATDWHLRQPPI